ncbi:MAG TPA: TonB-dependent receptor [Vicinamibacterales bacterium]|nr:TonB-dependent receptor [Vicinamibacterales bacterium]
MVVRVGRGLAMVIVLACAWAPVARAQVERGEIRLTVTDQTGLPVAATGTLASEAPQLFRAFSTDAAGRFTLQELPFGVFRLVVERDGFVPSSILVEVRTAAPRSLTVQLSLAAVSSDVTVSSEPPLVDTARAGVTFSIGAPQIQDALPAVPGRRLLELVDAQPGWLMEANGVLHPRGSEYQTLFVIDGIPMDENRSPAFAPDLQDGDVQGMGVLTGNFPAEYGRKLGGVIEVTTARDIERGFHAVIDAGAGSFRTASAGATARYGWARRAVTVGASRAATDRYLDAPTPENFSNHGSLGGVTGTYDEQLNDANRLRVTWHHRTTDFLVPNERVQERAGQRQERTGSEDLGQGSWTSLVGSRFVVNARGMVERIGAALASNRASTPIVVSQRRRLSRGYANASLAADLGRHQVKVGGDLVAAPVREEVAYEITAPDAFPPGTATTFSFADRRTDREQSLFAQDTMRLGAFTVSAGLRWDRYAFVVHDSAFSPRLGVAWAAPDADLVFRASYDRAFQTPAVENLLLASSTQADAANDTTVRLPVVPSRGNFLEAGMTAGFARRLRLDVTTYRRSFSQFADDDVFLNTGVSFPVAFASTRIAGLDAKVTLLPVRRVSGFVSYSLLGGTARLPVVGGLFVGEEALDELEAEGDVAITQDQRHSARGQVRLAATGALWFAGTVRYGSGLPVELEAAVDDAELVTQFGAATVDRVDFARGRLRSNLSLDLGAGLRVWQRGRHRLVVRFEAGNVTNRLNVINFAGVFSGTALGASRSVSARAQVQF